MRIAIIAGARPNFMKIAPIIDAIHSAQKKGLNISYRLVHTGQHYDEKMSKSFFDELNIPLPDINLECGGGTQAQQTASIMLKFEEDLIKNPVDLVLVVGDVTSTMACSIVAQKLKTKVAHVEGGIRSGDWDMPEEINRLVTDSISNYFFTTSETANQNLLNSGTNPNNIFFVGNTMIDTLLKNEKRFIKPDIFNIFRLEEKKYFVLTLHRPSNVDSPDKFHSILKEIMDNSNGFPIIFPVHPRTRKNLEGNSYPQFHFVEPMNYLSFNYLVKHSKAVITDSGGITEETTVLGIPCITLRDSTERPETHTIGTNILIGTDPRKIKHTLEKLFKNKWQIGAIPPLWDGKAADRIVDILLNL
jgi:UDP-N-acetylglucosamine 2-epimerase (non-hydrolysing)